MLGLRNVLRRRGWRIGPVTGAAAALLDHVRAQGFDSIRIPVTWSAYQGSPPGYTVESAYLSRVKEVVDWALADGFPRSPAGSGTRR